ncbi:putative multicopper oxidase [Annulohypoxylon truncatum]|uniref:putative multicopper oxidase n=1 Tax=Annulohypoxylon truncatum TaxID=327061 RepID=UPI002008683D|nr:putative multicopper oxidase [Annulohypoxylon truncatum]KAI1205570.1 putative multicopper oxidase [Annulohypoxylon truncatum]
MTSVRRWIIEALNAQSVSNSTIGRDLPEQDSTSNLAVPHAQYQSRCLAYHASSDCSWEGMNATNTNPYKTRPDTGVTRTYDFTITKGTAAPDGVEAELLLVNSQFPGPLIECDWGDWVEITVHNNISDEGTAIHWHGMLQQETPWMDGVPGISQCPIAPGSSYTYSFKPDLYGTCWYHSHYEAQAVSGFAGPMVIHGPTHVDYDIDIGPIAISDHFHQYYDVITGGFLENNVEVTLSDNNLINGKNSYNNNGAPLASFNFTSGKTHRLRLINTSAFAVQKVSIDGYNMTIITNDLVPIEPYDTDVVTLAPGQRSDVLVRATGRPTDSIWLRAYKPPNCSPGKQGSYLANAVIFYENADRTRKPRSQPGLNAYNNYCGNDPLSRTVPVYPIAPDEPSVTEILPIELRPNGSSNLWFMANRTFRVDYNDPQLLGARDGKFEFPHIQNVHNYGSNSSLRFIIENTGFQPHPVHIHGHNFFVLQEGRCGDNETVFPHGQPEFAHVFSPGEASDHFGGGTRSSSLPQRGINVSQAEEYVEKWKPDKSKATFIGNYGSCWNGSIVNPRNPQRRDVQMLLPGHYIVIQWTQDNPGIWPLHCHIAWHLSGGMGWMILERPDDFYDDANISHAMSRTCVDWEVWTNKNVVNQIDGGL